MPSPRGAPCKLLAAELRFGRRQSPKETDVDAISGLRVAIVLLFGTGPLQMLQRATSTAMSTHGISLQPKASRGRRHWRCSALEHKTSLSQAAATRGNCTIFTNVVAQRDKKIRLLRPEQLALP